MRLENFGIASSIELQFEKAFWDLHNSAIFRGFELLPDDNSAVMKWSSANSPSLPGRSGARLVFIGLKYVYMSARDNDLPLREDTCVAAIVKVDPKVQHPDPYMRPVSESSDEFRLAFCFQSTRIIEIESDAVRFALIRDND